MSLIFEPNDELMVADLKLEKTKYERVPDPHLQSGVYTLIRKKVSASVRGCWEIVKTFRALPMNLRQRTTTYGARTARSNPPDENSKCWGQGLAFDKCF